MRGGDGGSKAPCGLHLHFALTVVSSPPH